MSTARTAVAASPSPQASAYGGGTSYPTQQQQQQQNYHPNPTDAETLSNTIANSQAAGDYGNHIVAPIAIRPGRFTEEWDASQRGSSIVDGPSNGAGMQRTASYAGPGTGLTNDGSASLSRVNTLKKRSSVRRSMSLRRSGSRRSMRAGSVRSLALQSTTDQDEMHSAFYCPVPTAGNPTEVLANRFQGSLPLPRPSLPNPAPRWHMPKGRSLCERRGSR